MLSRIRRAITGAVDAQDVMALGGLASLFYGLHLWSPALAFTVLGVVLLAAAVVPTLGGGRR